MKFKWSRVLCLVLACTILAGIVVVERNALATARLTNTIHDYGTNQLQGTPASLLCRLLAIRSFLIDSHVTTERLLGMLQDPALGCEARLHMAITMVGTLPADQVDQLLAAMIRVGFLYHKIAGDNHCLRLIGFDLIYNVPERSLSELEFVKFLVSMHELSCGWAIVLAPHLKDCGLHNMALSPELLRTRDWKNLGEWDTADTVGLYSARESLAELPISRSFRSMELAEVVRTVRAVDPLFAPSEEWLAHQEFGVMEGWTLVARGRQ